MLFKEKPNIDYLRRFYWLDGAIYRMVSINDYNVAKDALTDVVLVKVQDRANYTSVDVVSGSTLTLTLSSNSVGFSGGTVQYTIVVSDGGDWIMDYYDSQTLVSATAGTGDYTGTWTIPANGGTSAIQRGMTVVAGEASVRVYLTQAGVTLSLEGPHEQGDVDFSGGTRTFTLKCPDSNWSAKTDYSGIITAITPSQGSATDSGGTTITVGLGRNNDASSRSAYIYVQTPNGGYQRSSYINQNGAGNPYLTLSPDYVYQYPASGGTIQVAVSSNREWYCENYYPDVCYTTDTASTSGDTTITVTVNENTGNSRFGSIYFRFADAPGNAAAVWTVSQAANPVPSLTLDTSGGTASWHADKKIVGYTLRNADTVYTQVSGASWITDVQTGTTGATITYSENTTESARTGWVLFSIDNENWESYELTQEINVYNNMPLTLDIVSGGTVSFRGYATPMYYSTDNGTTWSGGSNNFEINVDAGDRVMLKCACDTLSGTSNHFSASTAYFNVEGNIMSILYGDAFDGTQTTLNGKDYCFRYLFGKANVISAENLILPSAQNGGNGKEYLGMFQYDDKLIKTPSELPTGDYYTFQDMFMNCTGLLDASYMKLPDTVHYGCYRGMFQGCTSLQTAPDLPSTGGTSDCYKYMFLECSALTYIKCLLAEYQSYWTDDWTLNVSANGTFVKNAANTGWGTGRDGIPSGWDVVDA